MALMDLAGKAYGVPAYALIGGRFRDEIRCYADTPSLPDPHAMGARLLDRKQRGVHDAEDGCGHRTAVGRAGGADRAAGCPRGPDDDASVHRASRSPRRVSITWCLCRVVRSVVGYDIALAADHFGHIALDSFVTGLPRPLIQNGHITVPHTPGPGFGDIDEESLCRHLDPRDPVFFAETTPWDGESSHNRLWS